MAQLAPMEKLGGIFNYWGWEFGVLLKIPFKVFVSVVRYATKRQLTELRRTANIHYRHPAAWRSVAGRRQSTLALSAPLIQGAMKSLQDMRDSPDLAWLKLLQDATSFAEKKHDILPVLKEKRVKKVKRMPGELVQDEPIDSGEEACKCKVC